MASSQQDRRPKDPRQSPRLRAPIERAFTRELATWLQQYKGWCLANLDYVTAIRKQKDPIGAEKALLEQLRKLLTGYGMREARRAAIAAGDEVGGRVVIPEGFVADALAKKPVRLKWFWEASSRGVTERVTDLSDTLKDEVRTSVQRILTDANAEGVKPSTGEIARRIATQYHGDEVEGRVRGFSFERANVIAQTELAQSENLGIYNGYAMSGVDEIEWIRFGTGNPGNRRHDLMDHKRTPVGEPFVTPLGNRLMFPGDPDAPINETINCFPGDALIELASPALRAFRRCYTGPLVEVVTASGHKLAATPNHPVLTPEGWIAIGLLDEGDHLVRRALGQIRDGAAGYRDQVPTDLREFFRLFHGVRARKSVGVDLNFHGDRSDGEVDVVDADRELFHCLDTAPPEHRSKLGLAATHQRQVSLLSERPGRQILDRALRAANGGVSCFGQCDPVTLAQSGRSNVGSLLAVPWGDTGFEDAAANHGARHAECHRQSQLRLSGPIASSDLRHGHVVMAPSESVLPQIPNDRRAPYAEPVSDLLRDESLFLEFDRITHKRVIEWSDHVYSAETLVRWYMVNGFVVHNCTCTMRPVFKRRGA